MFSAKKGKRMEERRKIDRVRYNAKSVIVVCETGEKYYVDVENVSPLGMGIKMPAGSPDLVGKDIIIVAECLIMFAQVKRMVPCEDGRIETGIQAKKFDGDVLQYLFEHIG